MRLKNGSVLAPFSASNCDVRCHNWLHISHSLGFSLLPKGFCHRNCHLSVVLGDSTSPLELWSSNSFTLSPDGFLGPLRSSNFASDCGSILYIGSGATSCVGSDDYICRSPLPDTCIHSMSSTFAPLPLYATCTSIIASGMGSQIGVGIDDSINESLLPFTSTSFALAFILLLALYDLRVINCVIESSLLSTIIWLFWSVHALLAFAFSITMLWQDAFTVVMGHIRTLYHFISLTLCHLLQVSDAHLISDEYFRATCGYLRHRFFALGLGDNLRDSPLPSSVTVMTRKNSREVIYHQPRTTPMNEEAEQLARANEIASIDDTSSLPSECMNSGHSMLDNDFALACSFYTTFNPAFHSSETVGEDGFLSPILDTGATHCLLPLDWLTPTQASSSKRIHLKVASGSSVRALLYNNLIYCATVSRPLLSVGQLKAMLDLRFLWDDSAPCIIACSGGLRYILLEASVMHHLPVVSRHEMHVLLEALHCFTETGNLWNALTWSQKLGRKLALYHWSDPIRILPQEHSQFTDDPQVNFSSLQSSSSQPLPVTSSDILPSSSVFTYNLGDRGPPTEDEEMTGEEGKIEGGISRQTSPRTSSKQIGDKGAHRAQTEKERGSDSGELSHKSLRQEEREVRGRIRKEDRRKGTDNTVFTNGASTVNNPVRPKHTN